MFLVAGFLNCLLVVFDLDPGRCSLLGIFVDDEGPHIFHTRAGRDNLSSFTFAFVIVEAVAICMFCFITPLHLRV